ncbi:MAG: Calx-beta domain-containing protein [Bacteroidota bacterium]
MRLKNILGLLLLVGMAALTSCDYESLEEELALANINSTTENAFVRFDNAITEAIAIDEDAGTQEVTVEFPFPLEGDVAVSYDISGSAVAGTDYTIEGTSGSITLPFDPETLLQTDADITINILRDSVADGAKQLILTLTDASVGGTSLAVGQGPLFKEVTIDIADLD